MSKPLLLLDVDGPLNPFAAKPTRRPEGYATYRLEQGWSPEGRIARWGEQGMRVWLNKEHGRELLALTDVVDLVWCTMWNELANHLISPVLGLPELPVIEVQYKHDTKHIFKLDAVDGYVDELPFAWFDDDFMPADMEWAKLRNADCSPTLLAPIDPRRGLIASDFSAVRAWAESIDG